MFSNDILTFQEFVMSEMVPLATIHKAIFTFLQGRDDVVVFGAQAVNAYVDEPRMTQDIDLLSLQAADLSIMLREHLSQQFHIAVRIREVAQGQGFRLFQLQKSGNRHLVDIRSVSTLPAAQRIGQILVMAPADLIASKVIAYTRRRGQPKSGTDWRDLALLLLTFPELKNESGVVYERLYQLGADESVFATWQEFVAQEIHLADEDDEF